MTKKTNSTTKTNDEDTQKTTSGKSAGAASASVAAETIKDNAASAGDVAEKRGTVSTTVMAIAAIFMIFAVFAVAVWAVSSTARTHVGTIASAGDLRTGQDGKIVFDAADADIADGDDIVWYVNGKEVSRSKYTKGSEVALNYCPECGGATKVRVDVGKKYTQTAELEVKNPLLTFTPDDVTITYGEQPPQLTYKCNGCDDATYCRNCVVDQGKLAVGTYKIRFDDTPDVENYDAQYGTGTLTVLPRHVTLAKSISKTYDGTDRVVLKDAALDGVADGDNVILKNADMRFEDKNVGKNKNITIENVTLVGDDAQNYLLDNATGEITKKKLSIVGFAAEDKSYDGTSKAKVRSAGRLVGVVDGDSVAIGGIEARFDDAMQGNGKNVTATATLVGLDKNNYEISDISSTANITSSAANSSRDGSVQGNG